MLIEQAYSKIYESTSVLIPRRNREERQKNYQIALQKQIKEYIKNGSQGDLDLSDTPITSLPKGLTVGGHLYLSRKQITSLPEGLTVGGSLGLFNTPISKQYSVEQLKQMLPNVKGSIYI